MKEASRHLGQPPSCGRISGEKSSGEASQDLVAILPSGMRKGFRVVSKMIPEYPHHCAASCRFVTDAEQKGGQPEPVSFQHVSGGLAGGANRAAAGVEAAAALVVEIRQDA